MMFLKRLFNSGVKKSATDNLVGPAMQQSQEKQDATRKKMDEELADARERREAADTPPAS